MDGRVRVGRGVVSSRMALEDSSRSGREWSGGVEWASTSDRRIMRPETGARTRSTALVGVVSTFVTIPGGVGPLH